MFLKVKAELEEIIGRLSEAAQAYKMLVLISSVVLMLLSMMYIKNNIGINTDTENMLSEELPWRTAYSQFKENFPFFADNIIIVTDADSPDVAQDAAQALATALSADTTHFESVVHLAEHSFFRRNQFLFLSSEELHELSNNISRSQALLSQLLDSPTATRLLETIGQALDYRGEQTIDGFDSILGQISHTIDESAKNQFRPMSWQNILSGQASKQAKDQSANSRVIFTVKPVMDFSAILPAADAITKLRSEIENLQTNYQGSVKIRLTGGAALSHDEMSSVIEGSLKAGLLALILVFFCLFLGLRSWVLVLSTLITLIIGLTFTAVFAIAAVGTLNMISIAFAVLYVGLGVDFAIHICLKYKELSDQNTHAEAKRELVKLATKQVGASIALCALTTAIGFFAFIPTDYKGVAELGLIAGVGMFISLITSVIILPASLQVLPALKAKSNSNARPARFNVVSPGNTKTILAVAGCLWFIASISVSFISFDIDPVKLNNQHAESVILLKELSSTGNNTYTVSVLAKNQTELADLQAALNEVVSIESVTTVESLIPKGQGDKFSLVDDLILILGDDVAPNSDSQLDTAKLKTALEILAVEIETTLADDNGAIRELLTAINQYLIFLDTLNPSLATESLSLLNRNLMSSFFGRMNRLNDALNPSEVTIETLPREIRERWMSAQGFYRIDAVPREALSTNASLRAFVEDVQRVAGSKATGAPIINVGAADAVQTAFIQAFCYALGFITILLWVILRSFKEVVVTLFPLLLAGLLTCSAMVLLGLKFNFANIIALPLLLGIGVDSALHLLHRYKTDMSDSISLLNTSTAKAVFFSAATTTVSFGTLAASSHTGTASMGVVLSIGIVALLFSMLIILPAMLLMFVEPRSTSN